MTKNTNNLDEAIRIVKKDCKINPDKYVPYRNGYIFHANTNDDMTTLFLVDMDSKTAGPFSIAFDLDGYLKVANDFKMVK